MQMHNESNTTLSEAYEYAVRTLTLLLGKDPWVTREEVIAMTLDDCLLRLKLWANEIGHADGALEQADHEAGDLKSAIGYFLMQIETSIEEIVSAREDPLADQFQR